MSFSRWVVTVRFDSCDDFVLSPSAPQISMLLFFFHVDSIILHRVVCPLRGLLCLMCAFILYSMNFFFLWLDETPLRHRGIFGATSWHVVHVFHSMLFFFHFASFFRRGCVRPL